MVIPKHIEEKIKHLEYENERLKKQVEQSRERAAIADERFEEAIRLIRQVPECESIEDARAKALVFIQKYMEGAV